MSVFAEDLFSFLAGVGTSAGSRVYPNALPQQPTLPAILYFMVSDPIETTLNGTSATRHPRYQLECYGATYLAAKQLAEETIAAAAGYVGTMGGATVYATFVDGDNARDNHDPELDRHWVNLDLIIWHGR